MEIQKDDDEPVVRSRYDELQGIAQALAVNVETMTKAINGNSTELDELRRAQRKQHFLALGTIIGVILIVAIGVLLFFFRQQSVNHDIQAVNRDIQAANHDIQAVQLRISNEVLCPLFRTFIKFESASQSNPNTSPEYKAEVAKSYIDIHRGFEALQCPPQ